MTRSKLLSEICPTDCIRDDICEVNDCDTICYPILNKMLDKYDKRIRAETLKPIKDLLDRNVSQIYFRQKIEEIINE